MPEESVEVSVVLPAYNEAATITTCVERTIDALSSFLPPASFEVIVAEDGCTDATPEIVSDLAQADSRVHHFHSDVRLGRGKALERAFRDARGDVLVYFDTDLATDLDHLETLVERVRRDGYDVVTGSRYVPGHHVSRPRRRSIPSAGFNALVRGLLRSRVRDHQCGFKAFDRAALFDLLDDVGDDHWFWDTEVLVRAQRADYRISEFPVQWTPRGDTSVDLVRDVFGMGGQTLRLWWQLAVQPRLTRRVSMVAGFAFAFLAAVVLALIVDPDAVVDALRHADPTFVVLAGVVYFVSWPVRGIRYRDILSSIGYQERIGLLTGAIFISQLGNLVVPARAGDAIRAYVVKARSDVPYSSGFASLVVERIYDLVTITALALAVFGGLLATGSIGDLTGGTGAAGEASESGQTALIAGLVAGTAALALVAVIGLTARSNRNYARAAVSRLSSDSYADYVAERLGRFAGDVQRTTTDRRAVVAIALTSIVIWVIDVATAVVVLLAFGVTVSPLVLLTVCTFAVGVANLAKVVPVSPGGIGLYEGAFTVLLVSLTPIAWPVALAAAIVDHAVKNAVTVVGGVASLVLLNVSLRTAIDEGGATVSGETSPSVE